MASGVYNSFKRDILKKIIDLANDTIKCCLMTASHSFAASSATNSVWADVSANEVASGSGYTTGGQALASKAVAVDNVNNRASFDADDVTWATSTITAAHAVLWDDTPTSPADPLICSIDFGGAQSSYAGDFKIQWHTSGIMLLS